MGISRLVEAADSRVSLPLLHLQMNAVVHVCATSSFGCFSEKAFRPHFIFRRGS